MFIEEFERLWCSVWLIPKLKPFLNILYARYVTCFGCGVVALKLALVVWLSTIVIVGWISCHSKVRDSSFYCFFRLGVWFVGRDNPTRRSDQARKEFKGSIVKVRVTTFIISRLSPSLRKAVPFPLPFLNISDLRCDYFIIKLCFGFKDWGIKSIKNMCVPSRSIKKVVNYRSTTPPTAVWETVYHIIVWNDYCFFQGQTKEFLHWIARKAYSISRKFEL